MVTVVTAGSYSLLNQQNISIYTIQFWVNKNNRLEWDLNQRPLDMSAGALPTKLTSPMLMVSLFCHNLCLL